MPPKAKRLTRKEAAEAREREKNERHRKELEEEERKKKEEERKKKDREVLADLLHIGVKSEDEAVFFQVEKKDWWKVFDAHRKTYVKSCKRSEMAKVEAYVSSPDEMISKCTNDFYCFKDDTHYYVFCLKIFLILHWTFQYKFKRIAGALSYLPETFNWVFTNQKEFEWALDMVRFNLTDDTEHIYGKSILKEVKKNFLEACIFVHTNFKVYFSEAGVIYLKSKTAKDPYDMFKEWINNINDLFGKSQVLWAMCDIGAFAVSLSEHTRGLYCAPPKSYYSSRLSTHINELKPDFNDRYIELLKDKFFVFQKRPLMYQLGIVKGSRNFEDVLEVREIAKFDFEMEKFISNSDSS